MIIFRYFLKEVFLTVITVTGILMLIFISNEFVRYLAAAAAGKYPGMVVLKLMMAVSPQLMGMLLPLGLFLGVLLSYGRLYADHEMTVLIGCGISKAQILRMTMVMGGIVTLVVAFQTLWSNPRLYAYKQTILAEAEATNMIETLMPGRFQADENGERVYYVESISKDREKIHNVFMATQQNDPKKRWDILSAADGYQWIEPKSNDRFIVTTDGYRYVGKPGNNEFEIIQFGKYGARLSEHEARISRKEHAVPTKELIQAYPDDLKMAAELQWRLSIPISVLVLAFLAVPLSEVKPRHGKYAKLFPSLLVYIIYANLIIASQDWIENGHLPVHLGMWWGHALFIALGIYLYRKKSV